MDADKIHPNRISHRGHRVHGEEATMNIGSFDFNSLCPL